MQVYMTRHTAVAWPFVSAAPPPLRTSPPSQITLGMQSVPLYRLPLMITSQRKFSFNGSMLDFSVTKSDGQPGKSPKVAG